MVQAQSPVKSPNDKKEYRVIQLGNGLRALLISEPKDENDEEMDESDSSIHGDSSAGEQDMESDAGFDDDNENEASNSMKEKLAAAAMTIGIGNFSDPANIGGLAHYLEHMVFMGSEKYPDENDFDAFTNLHGGSSNASTDCEVTTFQFDVTQKYFEPSLDRFAQFFIAPLMKEGSMNRELEAVESEYQMSLPTDYFRKQHIFSKLAKSDHPMGRFMWGNTYSLKTVPEKENIDVYQFLQDFRLKYYSAQFMTLAVQAKQSLDVLQEMVERIFSKVPNNGNAKPSFLHLNDSFQTPDFHKCYKVIPVKNHHQVILNWVLPSLVSKYREKPLHYVDWLVGHEGKGSIISYLRKKVWALQLSAGNDNSGFEHNSTCSLFSITVGLTDEGLDHLFEVITVVLEYLQMVRTIGAVKRVFEEIQTIEKNNFTWQEESSAIETVENLSDGMHIYSVEDYLTGDSLLFEYDPELINSCQDVLVPGSMNVVLMSPRFENESSTFEKEFWSQAPFSSSDIDPEWEKAWQDLSPRPELHIPNTNKYIATNFNLTSAESTDTPYPTSLCSTDKSKIWYKRDNNFSIPKAHIYYHLLSSLPNESAQNSAMLDLLVNIMDQNLKDEAYDAEVAQLSYGISSNECGLVIRTYGFNDKLPMLLFAIIDALINFDVSDDLFEGIKSQLVKTYYNKYIKSKFLCRDIRLSLLQKTYWSSIDRRNALSSISKETFLEFVEMFKKSVQLKGLIQGNITCNDAQKIHAEFEAKLKCSVNVTEPKVEVMSLPLQTYACKVQNFNNDDSNSTITNYYQYGPSDILNMSMMELVLTFMEEPCFDVLRTKEQLSYHVMCSTRDTFGIVGFVVLVCPQANKFSCDYVDRRIENFLDEFLESVKSKITEEDFKQKVESLIKLKQCADLYLKEEVDRNWSEIDADYYVFDRLEKEIDALRSFGLQDVRDWCVKNMSSTSTLRNRKLSIQVVGKGTKESGNIGVVSKLENVHSLQHIALPSDKNYISVTDIQKSKNNFQIYPLSKIV